MMTSSFFSRDSFLKRQGRTARARRIAELSQSEFSQDKALNIIIEEDEPRVPSRSSSPMSSYSTTSSSGLSRTSSVKARRRRANITDITIARGMIAHDSNDLQPLENLLATPRTAPQTPSPQQSIDSFRLAFADLAPKFPHPHSPLSFYEPTSPTSSISSGPCSAAGDMPITPSTSDDESSFTSPYYIEIQPLVITKHNQRPTSAFHDIASKNEVTLPEMYDSASESDCEWYTRELSNVITLRSPLPPSFPHQRTSRPDSIITTAPALKQPSPKNSTPSSTKRRSTRKSIIPNYPPPPVPDARPASISSTASIVDFPMTHTSRTKKVTPPVIHRPLPRSSVPADCVFNVDAADSSSAFSFSIYDVDLGDEQSGSSSSAYSQPSFDAFSQEITFDLEGEMMFPVSLPVTPIDVDIESEFNMSENEVEFVFSEDEQIQQAPASVEDHSPSYPPSPSLSYYHSSASGSPSTSPAKHHVYVEDHALKSKWSTSTLASVHEEHARRGPSAKLRLYFGGQNSKRGSAQSNKKATAVPPTPSSPFSGLMSPRKASRSHTRGSSDFMPVLGYGSPVGVRRRGSVATISDAGSEESSSSTSSSGLRRKPIPVEMFLRSA